jgi:hypothetical protein
MWSASSFVGVAAPAVEAKHDTSTATLTPAAAKRRLHPARPSDDHNDAILNSLPCLTELRNRSASPGQILAAPARFSYLDDGVAMPHLSRIAEYPIGLAAGSVNNRGILFKP